MDWEKFKSERRYYMEKEFKRKMDWEQQHSIGWIKDEAFSRMDEYSRGIIENALSKAREELLKIDNEVSSIGADTFALVVIASFYLDNKK